MECVNCNYYLIDFEGFEFLNKVVECPNCKTKQTILWDEEIHSVKGLKLCLQKCNDKVDLFEYNVTTKEVKTCRCK